MSIAATYIDVDTFTIVGDQTLIFHVGRRVRADCAGDGIKYGTITSVSFDGTNTTTVDLTAASDDLTSNLDTVLLGIVGKGTSQSMPDHVHDTTEGAGGELDKIYFGGSTVLEAVSGGSKTTGDHEATTSLTVGGTVITDGDITDDGVFTLTPTTNVRVQGGGILQVRGTANLIEVGQDDTGQEGNLYLYGGTGDPLGGNIRLYNDAGSDTNHEYMSLRVNNEIFEIGTNNNINAIQIHMSSASLTMTIELATTFSGQIIMGDAVKQEWDSVPASTDTMTGDISSETVDTNGIGIGGLLVMATDGNFYEADTTANVGLLVLAVESGTGTKDVLWNGWATDSGWSWTPGKQLFVSAISGIMTQIKPEDPGEYVQVAGYATSATTIRFNPSPDYMELT